MRLATLLSRSDALHAALANAVGVLAQVPPATRATVTMDALMVASQHGEALRQLLALDLGVSRLGVLRMQYEAVLRAVSVLFAATRADVDALAAPLTPGTAKAARSLGLPAELLLAIEKSEAPLDLKRSLRKFRSSSWQILNSYVHAGLHPLRRQDAHHEHELATALRLSNGLAAIACGLMVIVGQRPKLQADINVACVSHPECMPPRLHRA